ncbi:MAG: hypothetical protein ACE5JM_06695, partial [Armatimonadota bacterium]
ELALFRRYLYGRRSEQLDLAQLMLEFARWLTALNAAAPAGAEGAPELSAQHLPSRGRESRRRADPS